MKWKDDMLRQPCINEHNLSSSWMRIHTDVVLQLALLMRFRFHFAELARIVVARVRLFTIRLGSGPTSSASQSSVCCTKIYSLFCCAVLERCIESFAACATCG